MELGVEETHTVLKVGAMKTPMMGVIRGSRPEVFCKKGVFKNFEKFTGKHLCQSLFFNKVGDSCEFCKFFKNTVFIEDL